tara:strand:+ start:315 stop:473 length:159 start_codon:yes stop_codon:yes gene_type:complete
LPLVPSYPIWISVVAPEYSPSGYETLDSTLTYGPAKADVAMNGDAATAANRV